MLWLLIGDFGIFGIAFQNISLTNNKSLTAGRSSLNYRTISAISIVYLLKPVMVRSYGWREVLFLNYSRIEGVKARLFPITRGQRVFLLFAGKPRFHKVSSKDFLTFNPETLP